MKGGAARGGAGVRVDLQSLVALKRVVSTVRWGDLAFGLRGENVGVEP